MFEGFLYLNHQIHESLTEDCQKPQFALFVSFRKKCTWIAHCASKRLRNVWTSSACRHDKVLSDRAI